MGEAKSNVSYECRKCGAKGTLTENVESINLNEIKLPCGCPAENGTFQIFHFKLHKGQEETLTPAQAVHAHAADEKKALD